MCYHTAAEQGPVEGSLGPGVRGEAKGTDRGQDTGAHGSIGTIGKSRDQICVSEKSLRSSV